MPIPHAAPLPKPLRTQLENTVKAARSTAEKAARAALAQLAVGEGMAPDYLTGELKALRRRLRAHGRSLGDAKAADDTQGVQHLVWEVAYQHWHQMLFARFLAENHLLLWEPGAAVSLDDCEALVQESDPAMNLGAKTKWELAGKLAARMLPQVFKPDSPVFALAFAPEHQRELERLLAVLATDVFQASDSLGWVYQFWQAQRKDEVNASEVKIGADELPAVTQLFTEPYMVDFLLHNSLGAWSATARDAGRHRLHGPHSLLSARLGRAQAQSGVVHAALRLGQRLLVRMLYTVAQPEPGIRLAKPRLLGRGTLGTGPQCRQQDRQRFAQAVASERRNTGERRGPGVGRALSAGSASAGQRAAKTYWCG